MAVCSQHFLLSCRLLRFARLPQMVADPAVYDLEGRLDRRCLHAHGLGAAGPGVCHSGPPVLVLVFVGIMVFESDYTLFTRIIFFGAGTETRACFQLGNCQGQLHLNEFVGARNFRIQLAACRNFRIQGRRTAQLWNQKARQKLPRWRSTCFRPYPAQLKTGPSGDGPTPLELARP